MHHFSSVNIHSFKGAVNRDFNIKKTANFNDTTSCIRIHFLYLWIKAFQPWATQAYNLLSLERETAKNQISSNNTQPRATEMICKDECTTKFKPDRTTTCYTLLPARGMFSAKADNEIPTQTYLPMRPYYTTLQNYVGTYSYKSRSESFKLE